MFGIVTIAITVTAITTIIITTTTVAINAEAPTSSH